MQDRQKPAPKQDRAARRADALRDNLRKRKEQQRKRAPQAPGATIVKEQE